MMRGVTLVPGVEVQVAHRQAIMIDGKQVGRVEPPGQIDEWMAVVYVGERAEMLTGFGATAEEAVANIVTWMRERAARQLAAVAKWEAMIGGGEKGDRDEG